MLKSASSHQDNGYSRRPQFGGLTQYQLARLEEEFSRTKTLHGTDLALLAAEMGAREDDLQVWYKNRVAMWRRDQGLSDCFGQI